MRQVGCHGRWFFHRPKSINARHPDQYQQEFVLLTGRDGIASLDVDKMTTVTLEGCHEEVAAPSGLESGVIAQRRVHKAILILGFPDGKRTPMWDSITLRAPNILACPEDFACAAEVGAEDSCTGLHQTPTADAASSPILPKEGPSKLPRLMADTGEANDNGEWFVHFLWPKGSSHWYRESQVCLFKQRPSPPPGHESL
jgi:hypothetical protein